MECHPRPIQKPIPIHVAAISPETFGIVAAKDLNIIQATTLMPLAELKAFCLDVLCPTTSGYGMSETWAYVSCNNISGAESFEQQSPI